MKWSYLHGYDHLFIVNSRRATGPVYLLSQLQPQSQPSLAFTLFLKASN